ncbi:MAG: HAD-IIIA family hydrolase [Deltaproteobacteria bacterium]|jgi:D-glycero-D-manno-heptose 1,7-bisphosphate phosphatase|nr:HAD-IIIA family hydrolase [Deltaproteobacteria bacterium]
MTLQRGVFFDRDGVLNEALLKDGKPYPPADAESLVVVPGARELLLSLKNKGFILICVTNQPDVARGSRTLDNVIAMNEKVRNFLPLDDLLVCIHDNIDNCDCRKPKPGMLVKGAKEFGLDLSRSFMVGDRASDIGAGRAAGSRTIFLDFDYNEPKPNPPADFTCFSLNEAVEIILNN